ncbi:hemolysin III family protein [Candidatus Saccharibacteria bacterium]|nr:hemolysin III family protein [Candidatus Saccharibacteria bacterium]
MSKKNKPKQLKNKLPEYSLAEELINAISHGVGASLSIAALVVCIVHSHSALGVISSCLYGSMMIILYIFSCLYHGLSPNTKGKKVLRILDHDNVFLMEAGTYMPVALGLLVNSGHVALGWTVFGVVWAITILAIVFTSINVDKYQIIGVICNLVLGWGALLMLPVLVQVLPASGILMLIIGGATYSLGALWFGIGAKIKWMHSIFHFYVILASIFHFILIYNFCI